MELTKIILIALIFSIIIVYLKSVNAEFALIATIGVSAILLILIVNSLSEVFSLYKNIATASGINQDVLAIVVKITVVCYIIEFSTSLIEDFGLKSLADKLSLIGKIIIVIMATPIIASILNIIDRLIS